ncbi:hypothetical protein KPL74_20730 [Bacillus sp. NP157]|nr:hypothetical protein KPL74_20730 [Bacillus sp. NP157]
MCQVQQFQASKPIQTCKLFAQVGRTTIECLNQGRDIPHNFFETNRKVVKIPTDHGNRMGLQEILVLQRSKVTKGDPLHLDKVALPRTHKFMLLASHCKIKATSKPRVGDRSVAQLGLTEQAKRIHGQLLGEIMVRLRSRDKGVDLLNLARAQFILG